MLRDDVSLQDIYHSGKTIMKFSQTLRKEELELDEANTAGIVLHIVIIGEAAKRLSPEFREQHPELPWR